MTDHENHDQLPYDLEETMLQVAGLVELLPDRQVRVLDVGCGAGRIAGPLLRGVGPERVELVGMDIDPAVEADFLAATEGDAIFTTGDLVDEASLPEGPFDLVLVLGNLLMTVREPGILRSSFSSIRARLRPGGCLVLDDFAEGGWSEIASGRWADGVDDTGSVQMVWLPGDPEFVVRMGSDVDPGSSTPAAGERVLRLWSRRELDDAASMAELSGGRHDPDHLLSVHQRR
jgi:SAM-dependent methyltransferase